MLMLICACGHAAQLPEESGRYVCSQCRRAHFLQFRAALDSNHPIIERLKAPGELETWRIEWRISSQAEPKVRAEGSAQD